MIDFRVIQPFTILPFVSMTREDNFLRFKGPEDYSTATMVVANDEIIENIASYGPDLLAYIPDGMDTTSLKYVAIIARETATSNETMLRFGMGPIPDYIAGSDRLVQLFVKTLFQTAGTDIYNPTMGGGLNNIKKQGAMTGDINLTAADIAAAIKKTERDVKSAQSSINVPAREKLAGVTILNISPDYHSSDINVLVYLRNVAGTRSYFNVTA